VVTNRMPASVHSLAEATCKPTENADAVILHYKALSDELEAQLAVALAQRDAWRDLAERCWQLVDAERSRWFK
jgi:DNA-binding transcriptional regulator PaaX